MRNYAKLCDAGHCRVFVQRELAKQRFSWLQWVSRPSFSSLIITRDHNLAPLRRFSSIAFTGIGARANAEQLFIGLDQIDEFPRSGNSCARGRTVAVILAASIAGTQPIGIAIDPAGDLDIAAPLGEVGAFYKTRRKDVGVWRLSAGPVAEHYCV
jgi:hypothetical protein